MQSVKNRYCYVHLRELKFVGIVCCHLHGDDFLHTGGMGFQDLLHKLKQKFQAGKVEEEDFQYTGFHIKQNENRYS